MDNFEKENSRLTGVVVVSDNRYQKRKNSKPGAVDFIPQEFDKLLEDQGTRIRLTPAILCPNQSDLYSENHALDCPLCFGTRVIDLEDKASESWASLTGIKLDKQFEVNGIFDMKDCQITFQAGVRVYYHYKIEILDFSSVFNQMIVKSAGDFDYVRYNPNTDSVDTPFYLVDKTGKHYCINEDYIVNKCERKIKWKLSSFERPAPGTVLSFSYPVLPTFRVVEMLNENRYYYVGFKQAEKKPIQLPQRALVRWDYLLNQSRQGNP